MKEKIDLLFKEFQEVKFRLDKVKQLNEEATDDRRSRRNDNNERRDVSIYRHGNINDDITHRIKVEASTFNDVHDLRVFSDWLADMHYYFDWYMIYEECKI